MNKQSHHKYFFPILIIVACVLWVLSFRDFFTGRSWLYSDGYAYFYMTKFYLDAILRGVYPMWTPFEAWGMDNTLNLRFIGEFNPFYIVPAVLYKMGFSYDRVYYAFAVLYYFFGAYGFYLISRLFFRDKQWAFVSFLLMLFSSASITIFFNYCEIVLLVPVIWFFYFLMRFTQNPETQTLLGITLSLMVVMVTYMPFYFITLFVVFLLSYAMIFPKQLFSYLKAYGSFIKKHKLFVLFCLFAVALSAVPGALWYQQAGSGEYVIEYRQSKSGVDNAAALSFKMISLGTIIGPLTFKKLFSGLLKQTNELSYFYLSVFIYPVLLFTFWNKLSRRSIVLFVVSVLMFLISLTDATPLHQFLYDRVFYFKLIRNIYYLLHMAIPFIVLFIVEQLYIWFNNTPQTTVRKVVRLFNVVGIHVLFIVFLFRLESVPTVTYWTVGISGLVFCLVVLGVIKRESKIFTVLMAGLIMAQPLVIFQSYSVNSHQKAVRRPIFRLPQSPPITYERAIVGQRANRERIYDLQDVPLETLTRFSGVRWVSLLYKNVSQSILQNYIKTRFIVYDRVHRMDDRNIDWKTVGLSMQVDKNVAFVSGDESVERAVAANIPSKAQRMMSKTDEFEILEFDLNHIKVKTNFSQQKFLVYNDGFRSQWNAFVNGQSVDIIKSNIAFKGLWLEPGENIVVFRYQSIWVHRFYFFLIFFFIAIAIYLIKEMMRRPKDVVA